MAESESAAAFSVSYGFPAKNFVTAWTEDIVSPPSVRGLVKAIEITNVTEEFSGSTTVHTVIIGTSSDTDAYISNAPITDTLAVAAAETLTLTRGATRLIPAAGSVRVTGTVGADAGSDEGISDVTVTILYFT